MKISQNKVVNITYVVEADGQVVETVYDYKPFDYIHGSHVMLPALEAVLEGLSEGDSFEATIAPADAYGEYDESWVKVLPKNAFEVDGKVREDLLVKGRIIPMYNGQGNVIQGIVSEIGEDTVTMDFNHPMAGKTLHFTGKVISIREATKKEIEEGLHGEYLPPQGGCHCGGGCHGGNCGGGCGEGGCGEGGCGEGGCCGN